MAVERIGGHIYLYINDTQVGYVYDYKYIDELPLGLGLDIGNTWAYFDNFTLCALP